MSGHHPPAPEAFMELEQAMVLIERIGLPGVLLGIMCYYIMKTQQAHREEIIRWEEKDTLGDSRLIDVIKEQNKQNATTAQALNDLNISNKDVTKSNERLASEIKGMAEALLSRRR
jgi:hypothetical protein|tara:strand:- start:428 stop:775 length:348 start_codon:yes stop_codon:yes gene_type:complete